MYFRGEKLRVGILSIYCENRDRTGLRHMRLFSKESGRLLAEVTDGNITTLVED